MALPTSQPEIQTSTTMTAKPDSNVEQRKLPSQTRSRQRVELILASCRKLLKEKGITAVTTTAIASEAGIPVSSLYQYYPNKKSILIAIYEDYLEKISEISATLETPKNVSLGWEAFMSKLFLALNQAELRDEIEDELEKALSIYPELAKVERKHREKMAKQLVGILQRLGAKWSEKKLQRLALFLYSINDAVWAYRTEFHPPKSELIEWQRASTLGLIRPCFD